MKISPFRPAHPKRDHNPSAAKKSALPRGTSSQERGRNAPRTPSGSRARSALPQGQLRRTQAARQPASPFCSARLGPGLLAGRDPKKKLRAHLHERLLSHLGSAHRFAAGSWRFPRRPGKRKSWHWGSWEGPERGTKEIAGPNASPGRVFRKPVKGRVVLRDGLKLMGPVREYTGSSLPPRQP